MTGCPTFIGLFFRTLIREDFGRVKYLWMALWLPKFSGLSCGKVLSVFSVSMTSPLRHILLYLDSWIAGGKILFTPPLKKYTCMLRQGMTLGRFLELVAAQKPCFYLQAVICIKHSKWFKQTNYIISACIVINYIKYILYYKIFMIQSHLQFKYITQAVSFMALLLPAEQRFSSLGSGWACGTLFYYLLS